MAEGTSFVVSWPKNIILSFVRPLPEDLDVYSEKCDNFMRNPHQTSDRLHICEECHKKASAKSNQHSAFPDGIYQDKIKALKVNCIHHEKGCKWSGKLEDLSAHLNNLAQRYEGCSYTEIRCKHDNCGLFYEWGKLKDHEDNCKLQPATCDFCHNFGNTLEEVEGYQKITRPKFLVPCTNEDHQDFTVQRENLQHHLDTDCPFQPIDCQFKWGRCNDRPKHKDEDQHNATSQQDHLLLLAGTCF
uniref:TRAF-type domain-containing protein n=1 Tax=Amphimedon queenslandica TaxID=400682 RepID=A0A1X7T161_AMPQE